MLSLPLPLIYEVCLYLDESDRQHLRCVSRACYDLIKDEAVWRYHLVSRGLKHLTSIMNISTIKQVLYQGLEDCRRFNRTIENLTKINVGLIEDQEGTNLFPDASSNCELRYVQDFDSCYNEVVEQRITFVPRFVRTPVQSSHAILNYPTQTTLICLIQYCDPDINCVLCGNRILRVYLERREYIDGVCTPHSLSSLDELKEHMLMLEEEKVPIGKMPLQYRKIVE